MAQQIRYSYLPWTGNGRMIKTTVDQHSNPPVKQEDLTGTAKTQALAIVLSDKQAAGNSKFQQQTLDEGQRLYRRTSYTLANSWEVKFTEAMVEIPWPGESEPASPSGFVGKLNNATVDVGVVGKQVSILVTGTLA